MWASAGNPSIGVDQFGAWLAEYDFTGKTWAQFMPDAGMALSKLCGEQRARTKAAGMEIQKGFLADCLVVGWLQEEPNICVLSDDGRISLEWGNRFRALGTGTSTVVPIHSAMLYSLTGYSVEQTVRGMLEVAARTAPNCGPPIEAWRITKDKKPRQLFHLIPRLEDAKVIEGDLTEQHSIASHLGDQRG